MSENTFEVGKQLVIEFSKKLLISSTPTQKKVWQEESQCYVPLEGQDGTPVMGIESRIKLPMSSENYRGFVFTTQEDLKVPNKYRYDKASGKNVNMGAMDNMLSFRVFENVPYKITRTPYLTDASGNIAVDESGRRQLDFEKQEIVKLSGAELKQEMDSWRKDLKQAQEAAKAKAADEDS